MARGRAATRATKSAPVLKYWRLRHNRTLAPTWPGAVKAYCDDLDRARTGNAACDWVQQHRVKTWVTQPALADLAVYLKDDLGLTCDCLQQVLNLGPMEVATRVTCTHTGTLEKPRKPT